MIPLKPLPLNFLLRPMTTLTGGKTQQKSNFPLSVWLSACGQGWNLSCTTKWVSPKNRPAPCKSLFQTVVYPCPFNLSLPQRHLSRSGCATRTLSSAVVPTVSSHTVPLPTTSPLQRRLRWCLCPSRASQEKNSLIIAIWVLPSFQTPLTIVNSMEKGSNKSELVQTSPSPPQGLQTHSW